MWLPAALRFRLFLNVRPDQPKAEFVSFEAKKRGLAEDLRVEGSDRYGTSKSLNC
jgi:hypothetical protein